MNSSDEFASRRRLLRLFMLAVFVWGSIIALGTALFGLDQATGDVHFSPSLIRGLIVESCVLAFLGLWWFVATRVKE